MPFVNPSEVPQVSLRRRGLRGYDRRQTEQLLANIAESYEQVWNERDQVRAEISELRNELAALRGRAREARDLQEEVARLQGKLASVHQLDERMRNALLSAEWMSEKSKEAARKESEKTLQKAQQRADVLVTHAERQAEKLRADIDRLQRLERETRESCRALLTAALRKLDGLPPEEEAEPALTTAPGLPTPFEDLEKEGP
jgi:peptidoglycan DL-endopeptidase RipA